MKHNILLLFFVISTSVSAEDISLCEEGWRYTELGEHGKAIELFKKCIEVGQLSNSSLSRTYRNIGIASSRSEQYHRAIRNYDKALSHNPDDPWDDYVNRGNAWSSLGEYEKSLLDYERAFKVKPHYNEAYYNRGVVFEKQNKIKEAIIEFKLAYKYGLRSELLQIRYAQYDLMKETNNNNPAIISNSKPLPIADSIRSVSNLSSQPCNGGIGVSMKGHPEEADIQALKIVALDSLGFKIVVPQLPYITDTNIKLYLGDRSRGVVDNYFLISEQPLSPPFAAIVITELPVYLQTSEKALDAVESMKRQSAFENNIDIILEPITSQYGEGLELIIENRIGSHCFPTSDIQLLPSSSEKKTIGISRFSMINKKLIEFSLIVTVPKGTSRMRSIEVARKLMDGYWLSLHRI